MTVGTELLAGNAVVNTNLTEICLALEQAGVEVAFSTTVGDVQSRIEGVLTVALERAEVVIVTGGLGPTHDDLTREAIAAATGRPLEFDAGLEADLKRFFEARGRTMSRLNLRQAYLPKGADAIPNPRGTAPGIQVEHGSCTIFALPGVPSEMRGMLRDRVLPWLDGLAGGTTFVTRTLKTVGMGESDLALRVADIIEGCAAEGRPEITILAKAGEVVLQMRAAGATREEAAKQIAPLDERFRSALGPLVFGADDQTLESVVSDLLKARNLTVAVAESFTGGALISRLISVPGASLCVKAGFVTYANEAKRELGVPQEVLDAHGAVSEEAARAMAVQARKRSGADVAISTTGEAGPLPAEEPVGTMFIGLATESEERVVRLQAAGDRSQIRLWGTNAGLNVLRLWLMGEPG